MKFRTYLACPNIVSKIHFRPYLLIFVKKISLFKEYYVKITDNFITQLTYFHTPGHNPMSSKMVWKRYKIEYIKINLDELRYTSGRKQIYFVIKERKQICNQRKETNLSSLLSPVINKRNPRDREGKLVQFSHD